MLDQDDYDPVSELIQFPEILILFHENQVRRNGNCVWKKK